MTSEKRFEAKNVDEAVKEACAYFGKDREELEVEVIDEGSSGIFGLGGRNSVVKAKPKSNPQQELENLVRDVMHNLLAPFVDEPELHIEANERRVQVGIEAPESSGLIIGKEGQTISALEYLANRILANSWPEKIYVQLDSGGYRDKQEEQVREKALELCQKVKESGKTLSTKPLSSYHRRVVHLALQDDEEIITHSKGEGPMKRVLIKPKRRSRKQDA